MALAQPETRPHQPARANFSSIYRIDAHRAGKPYPYSSTSYPPYPSVPSVREAAGYVQAEASGLKQKAGETVDGGGDASARRDRSPLCNAGRLIGLREFDDHMV